MKHDVTNLILRDKIQCFLYIYYRVLTSHIYLHIMQS